MDATDEEIDEFEKYASAPYRKKIYARFVAEGLSQYFREFISLPRALYEIRSSYFREYRLSVALWKRRALRVERYGGVPRTQAEIDYLEQIKDIYD